MKRNGFTLIEVLVGLCLLGLVSVTVLPIITTTSKLSNNNFKRMEMDYLGEMIIENLKAFKYNSGDTTYISTTKVEEIIDLFKTQEISNIKFVFPGKHANYNITIEKKEKNSRLWEILVSIDYIKEGDIKLVAYKAFMPSQ